MGARNLEQRDSEPCIAEADRHENYAVVAVEQEAWTLPEKEPLGTTIFRYLLDVVRVPEPDDTVLVKDDPVSLSRARDARGKHILGVVIGMVTEKVTE